MKDDIWHKGLINFLNSGEKEIGMEEKKNLLLFTGCNEILHYTANQIAMAYQQMGWNVFCESPKQEDVVKVMEILRRGIDRVLCLNNVGWLLDY